MTVQEYRKAVDCFAPDVYMKRRIAARLERAEEERRARPRRLLVRVLVAAAALVCLATAAFAVSPKLRQMVISLFQIEEVEPVPGHEEFPQGTEGLEGDISGQVQVQYVRLEGKGWMEQNGALGQYQDGELINQQYYTVEQGQLTKLDTHVVTLNAVYDMEIPFTFVWARTGDGIACSGSIC